MADSRAALLASVSENDFQADLIDRAHARGWLVHHSRKAQSRDGRWRTPLQGDSGFVDLVLARRGRLLLLELKSMSGRLAPAQRRWLDVLGTVPGAEVHVLCPGDWPLIDRLLA